MNILFVAVGSTSSQNGYITRIADEARMLAKHKTSLLLYVPIMEYIEYTIFHKNTPVTSLFNGIFDSFHLFPSVQHFHLCCFKRVILRILVAHYNVDYLYAESTAAGYLLSKTRVDIPYILDLHGFSEYETILRSEAKGRGKITAFIARKAAHNLDRSAILGSYKIVAVSDKMRLHLNDKYNYPLENISVIQCYPREIKTMGDLSHWKKNRQEIRGTLDIQNNTTVLGYLGGLGVYQMIDTIISFFQEYYNYNHDSVLLMIVVGDLSKLNDLVENSKLKDKIIILNNIPHNNVSDYLCAIDFGILFRKEDPVNYYASPTKFGEYTYSGIPLLASKNIGDFDTFISNNELGISISQDFTADAKLVKNMAEYMINRRNTASRIKAWTANKYNWKVVEKEFYKLFN